MSENASLGSISPFFIVKDIHESVRFYVERLGFGVQLLAPEEDPIFALVRRDAVQILLKVISDEIEPQPNPTRHEWAPWDAFVFVEDPASLVRELGSRGLVFHRELAIRDDGLHGFEVRDSDGYVLFFGTPA